MNRWLALPFAALFLLALVWCVQQWRYTQAMAAGDTGAATALWPAQAEGWRLAADNALTAGQAAPALVDAQHAVADDREDWQNWALLAQVQFEAGDTGAARASMAQMAQRAVGYQAHWSYANLLLLTGDVAGFYTQAAQSLAFAPPGEIAKALNQIWLAGPERFSPTVTAAVAQAVDPNQPAALDAATLSFLLDQNRLDLAAPWWAALLARHPQDALALGRRYLGMMAEAGDPQAAAALALGIRQGVFANAADALPWDICTRCGPWASQTGNTLEFNFQGNQPDSEVLARQWLLLRPSTSYTLQFASVGDPPIGVALHVAALGGPMPAGASLDVVALDASGPAPHRVTFTTTADPLAYQLQIAYQRPVGAMPLKADVEISGVAVVPAAR